MATKGIPKDIKLTIVIVDDNPSEHHFIKNALKRYKNILFNDYFSGADFLRFLEEKSKRPQPVKRMPDIVILDVDMPRLNGFEVFDIIEEKGLKDHIHFYILTTGLSDNDKTKCDKHQLKCYKKPFQIEQFSELLEDMIKEYIEH